jgi:hypothetical protein
VAHYPDTEKFLAQFRLTTFDVVARKACEVVTMVMGSILVIGGFRYAQLEHGVLGAAVGFHITNITLGAYVGVNTSILVSGLVRGHKPYDPSHTRLVILMSLLCSLATLLLVRFLVDGVVSIESSK